MQTAHMSPPAATTAGLCDPPRKGPERMPCCQAGSARYISAPTVPTAHRASMRIVSESGIRIGRKRVARLMRMASISGVSRRRAVRTTTHSQTDEKAPDLVNRDFTAKARDMLWVADITYVPTHSGFLYLSVVIDVISRRVASWSMANHLRRELVTDALDMAPCQRRPDEVIHHSDQGSQYTSVAFGKRGRQAGVGPSMGSVGDCYDNALCESFFASLECELLDRRRLPQRPTPGSPCSHSSRAFTIPLDDTPPSDICHP